MASYTTMFSSGQVHNQIKEFVVDTYDKIADINISQILPGSRTFVIKDETHEGNSQWYMLDHEGNWDPIDWNAGGGGSADDIIYDGGEEKDSGSDEDLEVIYDGGEES